MMMRSKYVMEFCSRCLRDVEHIRLTYINQTTMTCSFCQEETVIKKVRNKMKKTYTVVSVDEKDFNSDRRHMVVIELQRTTKPDKLGETDPVKYDTLMVHYPAYGETHFTRSVCEYPHNGVIDHIESEKISETIRAFLGLGE